MEEKWAKKIRERGKEKVLEQEFISWKEREWVEEVRGEQAERRGGE